MHIMHIVYIYSLYTYFLYFKLILYTFIPLFILIFYPYRSHFFFFVFSLFNIAVWIFVLCSFLFFFCFQFVFQSVCSAFPATSCKINKSLLKKWFVQDTFSFFGVYVSGFYHRLFPKLFQLSWFIFLYCFSFVYCIQSHQIVYNLIFEPLFLSFIYDLSSFYNDFSASIIKIIFPDQRCKISSPHSNWSFLHNQRSFLFFIHRILS